MSEQIPYGMTATDTERKGNAAIKIFSSFSLGLRKAGTKAKAEADHISLAD